MKGEVQLGPCASPSVDRTWLLHTSASSGLSTKERFMKPVFAGQPVKLKEFWHVYSAEAPGSCSKVICPLKLSKQNKVIIINEVPSITVCFPWGFQTDFSWDSFRIVQRIDF